MASLAPKHFADVIDVSPPGGHRPRTAVVPGVILGPLPPHGAHGTAHTANAGQEATAGTACTATTAATAAPTAATAASTLSVVELSANISARTTDACPTFHRQRMDCSHIKETVIPTRGRVFSPWKIGDAVILVIFVLCQVKRHPCKINHFRRHNFFYKTCAHKYFHSVTDLENEGNNLAPN